MRAPRKKSDRPEDSPLTALCKRREAFETPRWAIESVLDVEVITRRVLDPCAGLGAISDFIYLNGGHDVEALDVEDWTKHFPDAEPNCRIDQCSFFDYTCDLNDCTVVMNPPFTLAERFVDHALAMNARKVICFQRQAWRESGNRRAWWEAKAPARTWVCGARATCWRFDLLGTPKAEESGSPTSNAWYVWERGHKGAELTSAIYPREWRDGK